ncbi:hypothetical protein LshimejAT787_0202040 [Lyophyllum shimeji]|uniref:Uncharacterized protein n=1 Tax=Lyophyllum shimeji TaxID=47721 RepID=A0A9P3PFM5_LYOSH|nr:hypothetical protein LshimejAT787_0202040 [Lyophyllum shimeji]
MRGCCSTAEGVAEVLTVTGFGLKTLMMTARDEYRPGAASKKGISNPVANLRGGFLAITKVAKFEAPTVSELQLKLAAANWNLYTHPPYQPLKLHDVT